MAEKKQKQQITSLEELRKLDSNELVQKVNELKAQLTQQHRSLAAQELPSPAVIRKTRRAVAQALTVWQEKQHSAPQASSAKKEEEQ